MENKRYLLMVTTDRTIDLYCTICEKAIANLGFTPAPVEAIIEQTDHDVIHNKRRIWQLSKEKK